jgi:hypothetical protein
MEEDNTTTEDITDMTNEHDLVLATEDESYDKSSHLDGTIDDPRASMIQFIT